MWDDQSEDRYQTIEFANHQLILSGLGGIYWPGQKLLVVADLHLEKGSYYLTRGNPLPLYDTLDTLSRLEHLVSLYNPQCLLTLGDNIHDVQAVTRMNQENIDLLKKIRDSVSKWVWLIGNHDKHTVPKEPGLHVCTQLDIETITFTHDLLRDKPWQILGHYHPKATIKNISGKCFLVNNHKIILPAFGSYTGGLNIDSLDFKKIMHPEQFKAYLLNKNKVWRIR
ncbi:MAG: ligase-associated DNA damage response endonuclease PdeM [Legionella sp.]|nr:ligase-associated DNA damage response endonuclease PdeM [Legionella sp.]